MVVELPGDEEAKLLSTRLVSVKHIWELWCQGNTYDEVHEKAKSDEAKALWVSYPLRLISRETTIPFLADFHQLTSLLLQ